jgi:flagellar export protein FliJ
VKSLDTLIRVHEWKLNEERRKLADLIGFSNDMRSQISRIEQGLQAEAAVAGDSVDAARSYSAYLKSQMQRRGTLESSIAELESEIADVEECVAAAFKELKTYEISRDRRNAAAARQRAQREQATLDEIALNMHRMKQNTGAA